MIDAILTALRHAAGQTVELPLGAVILLYSYSPSRLRRLATPFLEKAGIELPAQKNES